MGHKNSRGVDPGLTNKGLKRRWLADTPQDSGWVEVQIRTKVDPLSRGFASPKVHKLKINGVFRLLARVPVDLQQR